MENSLNIWALVALILNGLIGIVLALGMFTLKGVTRSTESLRVDMKEGFERVSKDTEKLQTKEICTIYRTAEKAELDAAKHDVNQLGRKLQGHVEKKEG